MAGSLLKMEKGHKYGRVKYVEPILKKLPHCHYEWVHYAGTESWRPGYENHKYQSLLSKEILIAACVASLAAPLFLLYWKTRNIWACAIVHGLFDFFPSISGAIYNRLSPRLR